MFISERDIVVELVGDGSLSSNKCSLICVNPCPTGSCQKCCINRVAVLVFIGVKFYEEFCGKPAKSEGEADGRKSGSLGIFFQGPHTDHAFRRLYCSCQRSQYCDLRVAQAGDRGNLIRLCNLAECFVFRQIRLDAFGNAPASSRKSLGESIR
jgi:hypothetical protein